MGSDNHSFNFRVGPRCANLETEEFLYRAHLGPFETYGDQFPRRFFRVRHSVPGDRRDYARNSNSAFGCRLRRGCEDRFDRFFWFRHWLVSVGIFFLFFYGWVGIT